MQDGEDSDTIAEEEIVRTTVGLQEWCVVDLGGNLIRQGTRRDKNFQGYGFVFIPRSNAMI